MSKKEWGSRGAELLHDLIANEHHWAEKERDRPPMGINDRDYVRDAGPRGGSGIGKMRLVSVNKWLIIINVAVFLMESVIQPLLGASRDYLLEFGFFSTEMMMKELQVWRLLTFQFLHDQSNIMHIGLNMFGLWIFGPMVEQTLGSKKYLAFYLVCGIFGGLMYLLLNWMGYMGIPLPGALAISTSSQLIGASAGVFGVIMACAYIAPNSVVQLLFPPIPLKMKWMAYGYVGIALFNLLRQGHNAGGDAAHVGGAIAGFFFIRNHHLLGDFFDVLNDSRKTKPSNRYGGASFNSANAVEIDRILSKVSTQGLHSLTEAEKQTLSDDSERRRKRGA